MTDHIPLLAPLLCVLLLPLGGLIWLGGRDVEIGRERVRPGRRDNERLAE